MSHLVVCLDMVEKTLELMDRKDLQPLILNQASNEIPKQYLSAEKARRVLDWKHQYSLEEGLAKTITWYQNFLPKK